MNGWLKLQAYLLHKRLWWHNIVQNPPKSLSNTQTNRTGYADFHTLSSQDFRQVSLESHTTPQFIAQKTQKKGRLFLLENKQRARKHPQEIHLKGLRKTVCFCTGALKVDPIIKVVFITKSLKHEIPPGWKEVCLRKEKTTCRLDRISSAPFRSWICTGLKWLQITSERYFMLGLAVHITCSFLLNFVSDDLKVVKNHLSS